MPLEQAANNRNQAGYRAERSPETSPARVPEYKARATAQNDLVLKMLRDALRWPVLK